MGFTGFNRQDFPFKVTPGQQNAQLSGTLQMGSSFLRNVIGNGAMAVDQRNNGAAGTTAGAYTVDRWFYQNNSGGVRGTWNQSTVNPNLTNAPPVPYCLQYTSAGAYSPAAGDNINFDTSFEARDFARFQFGTPNAGAVNLSFRVICSITGTFSGALTNYNLTRSYPFVYSVPTANLWTTVSIQIPGDTGGAWAFNGNVGAATVYLSLGTGSTSQGIPGAWAAGGFIAAIGGTNIVSTAGAQIFFTAVQLESGTQATPFEQFSYQQVLAQCQRYCYVTSVGTAQSPFTYIWVVGTAGAVANLRFPVTMRATPALTSTSPANFWAKTVSTNFTLNALNLASATTDIAELGLGWATATATAGQVGELSGNGIGVATLIFNADL